MATSNLPDYVDRSNNQVLSAPADLENVTLYCFPIRSDMKMQQQVCDRFLNDPSPPHARSDYRAFLPHVFLMFAHNGALRPVEPERHRGYYNYLECGFWIPTVSFKTIGGISVASHLAIFPYWMFVDESYAMAAGREMQGWFKELASICVAGRCTGKEEGRSTSGAPSAWTYQNSDDEEFSTTVTTPGSDNIGKNIQTKLIGLTRFADAGGDLRLVKEGFKALFGDGFRSLFGGDGRIALPSLRFAASGLSAVPLSTSLRFALLKQFYATGDPDRACYQAGVEVTTRATKRGQRGFLPSRYRLHIEPLVSHPLVDELGLDEDTFHDVRGFFVDLDFRLETGVELWRKRRSPPRP